VIAAEGTGSGGAGPVSIRMLRRSRARREWIVVAALTVVALSLAIVSLVVGAFAVPIADVIAALTGRGGGAADFVILDLRLPRVLTAIVTGVGFGLAGAVFQTLLGNPLASPDIIGVSQGASAGAVAALLVAGASGILVSASALAGAAIVAILTTLLSWRGGVAGARFVLVGIAFAFLVNGVVGYLLSRADVRDAQAAVLWLVGSVGSTAWPDLIIAASIIAVLAVAIGLLAPRVRALQLGDDTARSLGVRVNGTRVALLACAVGAAATATAVVGPVAFVAFMSAPIARRLTRSGSASLIASALVAVLLLLLADFIGQHAIPGIQVPVGVITGVVGAPYLLWLIATGRKAVA
jgi:iron complex transport system permease protein